MHCKSCGRDLTGTTCPVCGVDCPATPTTADYSNLFLEADEYCVASVRRGYLPNLILGGFLGADYVIVSNKRLYYSGEVFRKTQKCSGSVVLPLEKIAAMDCRRIRNIGLLLGAGGYFLGGLLLGGVSDHKGLGLIFAAVGTFWAFCLLLRYMVQGGSGLYISSESAEIPVLFRRYGQQRVMDFWKALGRVLDESVAGDQGGVR